jgi:predicted deacylase
MRIETISLPHTSIGQSVSLTALHFGHESSVRKVYIQASLHADELPGALTAFHLRQQLTDLAHHISSHIVLVPLANPIGLAQQLLYTTQGRFELGTGQNFNRLGELDLYELTLKEIQNAQVTHGQDANANMTTIRAVMAQALAKYQTSTTLEAMHHQLLTWAFDADVVLDLHCDWRAVMHMYTTPDGWPVVEPLARYLGSRCQLIADDSGCNPFDEALSTAWTKLARYFPDANIPAACTATTVELRGQADVAHELAQQDAQAIVQFLMHRGDIVQDAASLPPLIAEPSPLAGVERLSATTAGLVVYHVEPGDHVRSGQMVAEIINPLSQNITPLTCHVDGFVFACNHYRYANTGDALMSISGSKELAHATLSP